MDLIRDCLDKQVEDRNGRRMGRVDGIVIELNAMDQPQVTFIELGTSTLADRLGKTIGHLVSRIIRRASHQTGDRYRLSWNKIVVAGITVIANVEAEKTPAL